MDTEETDISLIEDINRAIDYLLTEAYYEQVDLWFRNQCCSEELTDINKRKVFTNKCVKLINDCKYNDNNQEILDLVNMVDCKIFPKSIEDGNNSNVENKEEISGRWISNHRTKDEYIVDHVELYIDLPLELRIIDVLWCMKVGTILDAQLSSNCYANRIEKRAGKNLFKLYFNQYKSWRDSGLRRAEDCLENGKSVVLLSMDIKRCFYNIKVDWQLLFAQADSSEHYLCNIIQKIHQRYFIICSEILESEKISKKNCPQELVPIGLQSSRIISNWSLNKWDNKLVATLNPVYYGRYVDDMLIVLDNPPTNDVEDIGSIINHYFIKGGLLTNCENNEYKLNEMECTIRKSKLIGTYFDHMHSWAGLKSFIAELQIHNSEFKFLPTDEKGRELENTAFDILMEGSINKIRSILDVQENGTELSKYLSREIISHRLSVTPLLNTTRDQLRRFWKGRNLFDFARLWEKNFTLLFIKNDKESIIQFWGQIDELIKRVKYFNQKVQLSDKMRNNLKEYQQFAYSNMLSLENQKEADKWKLDASSFNSKIYECAGRVRKCNFSRLQYIVWPFLQFSNYAGNLAQLDMRSVMVYLQSNEIQINTGFRFLYDDERQVYRILRNIAEGSANITNLKDLGLKESIEKKHSKIIPICLDELNSLRNDDITIAIANLQVKESNIKASYEALYGNPNVESGRWQEMSKLLNLAVEEKCDLLILPEVSIPWMWLPLMVSHARRRKLGLVFGLEHLVVEKNRKKYITNTVVAALPYLNNGSVQCAVIARSKNHYSPYEKSEFKRLHYRLLSPRPHKYHLIKWRGMSFTIFNCFELTDIQQRGLFRGNIDALFAVEWNRDISYFSNIVESAAVDIHCTIIQTNTSEYGDSRIYSPYHEAHKRDIIRVKGGNNTTVLKTMLNFKDQRGFQKRPFSPDDKQFKPTPAGFKYIER